MSTHKDAVIRATAIGTVLQLAMVIAGHFVASVAMLFGPLGMAISLVAGVLYARGAGPESRWHVGALVGGACALIGIAVSYGLGDVTAMILAFGTLSSAVAGALGAWLAARFLTRSSAVRSA